jgi:hypothetical protein
MTISTENEMQIRVGNTLITISADGQDVSISGDRLGRINVKGDFNDVTVNGAQATCSGGRVFNRVRFPVDRPSIENGTAISTDQVALLEVGQLTKQGVFIGSFLDDLTRVEKAWFADVDDLRDSTGQRLTPDFNAASEGAKSWRSLGYDNWILPPGDDMCDPEGKPDILDALFQIKDKFNNRSDGVRGFDESGIYASSAPTVTGANDFVKIQRFSDGVHTVATKEYGTSVRYVRSLPIIK